MAECKYCSRSGWFLSVTKNGLCDNCDPIVSLDVHQRARIIFDSVEIVAKSKKLETQLSRCDLLLDHARALVDYERRGIPTIDPVPSALLREFEEKREQIIVDSLQELVESTLAKARLVTSDRARVSQASKAMFVVQDYLDKSKRRKVLESLQKRVKEFIHETQLNAHMEAAKKAEFKGQVKKALDKYRDALYFLKHDDIDDTLQTQHISTIEQKIAELEKAQ